MAVGALLVDLIPSRFGLCLSTFGFARGPGELLTPRELEVLGLIRRGMRNQEIANALFISTSTTKVHIRHVFEKLGVRTRAEAVARYEMFSDAE